MNLMNQEVESKKKNHATKKMKQPWSKQINF